MDQRIQESLQRIDHEASAMQRELEKRHLRQIQGRALRAGAACCDNTSATAEEVQNCIKNSQQPLARVQSVIKQELEEYQQRLHRGMLVCQDRAKDSMTYGDKMNPETERKFADCMCACADEHLKLLPAIKERLISAINQV